MDVPSVNEVDGHTTEAVVVVLPGAGTPAQALQLTTVTATSAELGGHSAAVIVQRSTTGPLPLVCVKVAFGVLASGLKGPVPPLTMLHAPVPLVGVLPPKPVVMPLVQIV